MLNPGRASGPGRTTCSALGARTRGVRQLAQAAFLLLLALGAVIGLGPIAMSARPAYAAVSPDEYRYASAQNSTYTLTNASDSIDAAFDDDAARFTALFCNTAGNLWTFTSIQNMSGSAVAGVLVEIRFRVQNYVNDTFVLEIYDGASWSTVATYNSTTPPPSRLATRSYDVTSTLNSVAKVNAAQVRLRSVSRGGSADNLTISVDGVRLGIEWPASYGTSINPNRSASGDPGATLSYPHTVTNTGSVSDLKNVTVSSSRSWTVALFRADGTTSLSDSAGDGDGLPDTGSLAPGASITIVVKVTIPSGAATGLQDVTTVRATSAVDPAATATVADTTTVNATLRLTLDVSTTTFGQIGPDGALDPSANGVSVSVDGLGAYYVQNAGSGAGSVLVTVESNSPWTGYVRADENSGSAVTAPGGNTPIRVADGRLEWRLDPSGTWSAFESATQGAPYNNNAFASRAVGTNAYRYDYRLRVNWTDVTGTFLSTITYTVSQ